MKSGRTFWDELCHKYDDGVHEARRFLAIWDAIQPYVDAQRFEEMQRKLRIQARDSEWWRDAHNLDEMMRFRIPISMYENPESGYNK